MTGIVATEVSAVELVKLAKEGALLLCPACREPLRTVPANWKAGMPFAGVECPRSQRHFLIHCDDAETMREVRRRIRGFTRRKSP
jgi:uncharacterized protein YbaR (Trm112 family)